MKKDFIIPVTVKAFSRQEAEAKITLLLQGGSFIKDFNVPDLAGAILNHFVWAKVGETANKIRLENRAQINTHQPSAPKTEWLKPVKKPSL